MNDLNNSPEAHAELLAAYRDLYQRNVPAGRFSEREAALAARCVEHVRDLKREMGQTLASLGLALAAASLHMKRDETDQAAGQVRFAADLALASLKVLAGARADGPVEDERPS